MLAPAFAGVAIVYLVFPRRAGCWIVVSLFWWVARSGPARRDWSIEEKTRVLAAASTVTGGELTDFLQREGVLQADYEQWRVALGEEGRASLVTMKRIRMLEHELARKEKALAEAAALLVLKKLQALEEDEDDDTREEHEP